MPAGEWSREEFGKICKNAAHVLPDLQIPQKNCSRFNGNA
jgi:hypothetical protein